MTSVDLTIILPCRAPGLVTAQSNFQKKALCQWQKPACHVTLRFVTVNLFSNKRTPYGTTYHRVIYYFENILSIRNDLEMYRKIKLCKASRVSGTKSLPSLPYLNPNIKTYMRVIENTGWLIFIYFCNQVPHNIIDNKEKSNVRFSHPPQRYTNHSSSTHLSPRRKSFHV